MALHLWCLLALLNLMALNCFGASLSLVGSGSYIVSGNTAVLLADKLENNDFFGTSGTIRLELWAFSSPYPGVTSGYKLASHTLGQLNGGSYFYNISSASIPFVLPPPGIWYFSLLAREFVGTGGDGFTTRSYINFSSPVRVAGGAYFGDVLILGSTSWQVIGSTVNVKVSEVNNICTLGASGSLRLDLWAMASPYSGGAISNYKLGSVALNPLAGGFGYSNIDQTVAYTKPPDGYYYVVFTLSEYHDGSFVIVDYYNHPTPLIVGNPPSPPTVNAATAVTNSSFTASWSNAVGATGYRCDVSMSSDFSSFVSGYENVNLGNVTSVSVSGLSGGATYYYRIRAYSAVGTSGNSAIISVTTLPNPPPATPMANPATSITSSGFIANWSGVSGATGYRLDISTSSTFGTFASGYQDLDVGNVTTKVTSGLSAGTTYYYRVRAYNPYGTSSSSTTVTLTTAPFVPALSCTRQGTNFVVSWPTNDSAFNLEYATSLAAPIWLSNPTSPAIVSGQYTTTNGMTNSRRFYRLKK